MKKIFVVLLGFLLITGCATTNLNKRVEELEKRVKRVEIMRMAGTAASDFYPARSVSGDASGDADNIGASDPGSGNSDALFLTTDDNEGTAAYDWMLAVFKADDNDVLCSAEDLPWCIDTATANTYWTMLNVWGRKFFGGMHISDETGATVTVNDYESGTHFINDDNDVIEFDLPTSGPHGTNDITDLVYCFGNGHVSGTPVAQVITIDPGASDYIILNGTAASAGEAIVSSGNGKDNVCLLAIDEAYWKVTGYVGTWAEATP